MVVCELDNEVSGEILGWKLPTWQALLLHRVLPTCGGLINYLVIICYDFALVYEHFFNKSKILAVFCLFLIMLPAVISLLFTLASPPPSLLPDDSTYNMEIKKSDVKWILLEICKAVFFPFAVISRYSYLIFWWVEAVFASRLQDEKRTREALAKARVPASIELYLFLQAFIHSPPFVIINILDIIYNFSEYEKVLLQAISIIASSLRMAGITTVYRRFEREKICGRKYPWSVKFDENDDDDPIIKKNEIESTNEEQNEPIYEKILPRNQRLHSNVRIGSKTKFNSDLIQFSPRQSEVKQFSKSDRKEGVSTIYESDDVNKHNSDLIQFSPRQSQRTSIFYDDHYDSVSDTSSDYMAPVSKHEITDSDEEYVKPITIIDKVAPRRDKYNIQRVNLTPPPEFHAPRPGSLAVWAEKIVENAESIPHWLSAPTRRRHLEVIQSEPDLPRRVPSSRIRGLEPQDFVAAFIHFLAWYGFFISRMISLSAFINLTPFFSIIVLFIHYQVMLLFLIVPQAPTVRRAFYIFLAFIYLFCLMEFKIRFRHVRVWHFFWFLVCTVENIIFISLWATFDNPLHHWWKHFVVIVTIVSMLLGYMLFLIYFIYLQPRETVLHVDSIKRKNIPVK